MPHASTSSLAQRGRSALSVLDSALADLASGEIGLNSVTPDELHRSLVNHLWWEACVEAAEHCPQRVLTWYRGSDALISAVLTGNSEGAVAEDAVVDAARAVAGIGVALAAGRGELDEEIGAGALQGAITYWSTTGILPLTQATPAAHRLATKDLPPGVHRVLTTLDTLTGGAARSLAIVAVTMAAATALPRYTQRIRVLFDTSNGDQAGRTGTLEMAVLPGGPAGLYPDPRTMSFLRADREFAEALTAAWTCAVGDRASGPCVLWSITQEDQRIQPINGGSLGAAFAVALTELMGRRSIRRFSPLSMLRAFRTQCAVTGVVTANGDIGEVGGLDGKFTAAHRRRWSVVAPAVCRSDDGRGVPPGLDVSWVRNVGQARRKAQRWLPLPIIAVSAALTLAVAVVGTARYLDRLSTDKETADYNASDQQRIATAQGLLVQSEALRKDQPLTALRLGLAAMAINDTPQTRAGLVKTLNAERQTTTLTSGHGQVRAVLLGPNELALTDDDSGVVLWDLSDRAQPRIAASLSPDAGIRIRTAAMSEDGHLVLLGHDKPDSTETTSIELWDVTQPKDPRALYSFTSCVPVALAINARRAIALIGCTDGTVTLWGIADRTQPIRLADLTPVGNGLHSVTLSRSGTRALVASDAGVAVWNIATPDRPTIVDSRDETIPGIGPAYAVASDDTGATALIGHTSGLAELAHLNNPGGLKKPDKLQIDGRTGTVLAADLTADGRLALTGGEGAAAVLWEPTEHGGYRPRAILNGHTDTVTAVALSPDGRTALTGSRDGSTVLWDVSERDHYELRATMTSYPDAVHDVAFSTRTGAAVTLNGDGYATVLDLANPAHPQRMTRLAGNSPPIRAVAFQPGNDLVATGSDDGELTLWDLTDSQRPRRLSHTHLTDHQQPLRAVTFSPAGNVVATGSDDGTVTLWDVTDPARPRHLGNLTDHQQPLRAVTFSPAGNVVATGSDDGTVTLWDVTDPAQPRNITTLPALAGRVQALAFSPQGLHLLQANDSGRFLTHWDTSDPANPKEITRLVGHTDTVNALAYNADGTMAVTASRDGTAILWSVIDPYQPYRLAVLTGHTGPVLSAAFSPDGGTILTGGADKVAIIWDISKIATSTAKPRETACHIADRPLDKTEWAHYAPKIPYNDNCAN